jgi:hypothetical protein
VDEVALGPIFLRVLRYSTVVIIPPVLHTHLHLHVALTGKDKGAQRGYFPERNAVPKIGELRPFS